MARPRRRGLRGGDTSRLFCFPPKGGPLLHVSLHEKSPALSRAFFSCLTEGRVQRPPKRLPNFQFRPARTTAKSSRLRRLSKPTPANWLSSTAAPVLLTPTTLPPPTKPLFFRSRSKLTYRPSIFTLTLLRPKKPLVNAYSTPPPTVQPQLSLLRLSLKKPVLVGATRPPTVAAGPVVKKPVPTRAAPLPTPVPKKPKPSLRRSRRSVKAPPPVA